MPESDLATFSLEIFSPAVGQTFVAIFPDRRLPLTLAEARPLGAPLKPEMRPPFALTFVGKPKLRLPQSIYRFENATLGAMEIFIVQIADDADGSKFEAVFN